MHCHCHNDDCLLHNRILSCGGYAFFQVKELEIDLANLWLCRGCTLTGPKLMAASALDVGKGKGKGNVLSQYHIASPITVPYGLAQYVMGLNSCLCMGLGSIPKQLGPRSCLLRL